MITCLEYWQLIKDLFIDLCLIGSVRGGKIQDFSIHRYFSIKLNEMILNTVEYHCVTDAVYQILYERCS